jgi:ribosomal protein RSM22 (predicted rRNA methylase)
MQLPEELQLAIEEEIQNASSSLLKKARETLSQTYKDGKSSASIFSSDSQRLAYLIARMPATYAAVYSALQKVPIAPTSFLDLGAGPGTVSWAATELFPSLTQITLLERSPEAILLGKRLSQKGPSALQKAHWIQQCLTQLTSFQAADLAALSYVLGELKDPEKLIQICWNSPIQTFVFIEPGTPKGFQLIRKIRQQWLDLGGYLLAPCAHAFACPIQGNDWCHFSVRIERSRLHRLLKEGSLGYEDEKFSYLVVSRAPAKLTSRIVRHPQKLSGHVRLTLCTERGQLEEKVVTRSDKASYREARDASWGDPWL